MAQRNVRSLFQFASRSDIIKIILTITIVFVILQFIRISILLGGKSDGPFYAFVWYKMALPASASQFIRQPWSLFSWFLIDEQFMRIVGNMIWLWIFGSVIEDLKGSWQVWPVFITGGIVAALFTLISTLWFASGQAYFTGAEAAVTTVAFSALVFKPSYRFWWFFGLGIPIWVFVLIFLALQLSTIQLSNLPTLFMLLGAILCGLAYQNVLASYYTWFTQLFRRLDDGLGNDHFIIKKKVAPRPEQPFRRISVTPKRIDQILDKTSEKGIDALSAEERKILDEYSGSKNNPS